MGFCHRNLSNQTDLQAALNAKYNNPTGTSSQYIDGTGAYQTFPSTINYANTSGTSTNTYRAIVEDTRVAERTPNEYDDYRVSWEFTNQIQGVNLGASTWWSAMTTQGWHDGYAAWQIIGPASSAIDDFYLRSGVDDIWNTSRRIWHNGDFTSTNVSNWNTAYSWGNHAIQSYATQTYVNNAIANLVDSAPGTLDTLNELAAALGDDPNFATTVTNSIAAKVPQTRTLTINGTALDLSADRSWTISSADGYISDVRLQESTLEFTGEGSAFNGNIDLSTLPFAPQGSYLTAEADTLATVTGRGASTSTAVTFNGGATISGTGGDGSEVLRLTGSASDGFNYSTASVWGNLTAGETVAHIIGKAESQYNTANFGYRHVADGSSSNHVTIGMFQADNLLNILGNGNVGICTTSPSAKLEIAGFSTGAGLKLNYGNYSGTIEAVNFIANGGANGVIGMQMVSAGVGDLWLGGSGGRSLTLYRDGKVGIGTTAPAEEFHVLGRAIFDGGSGNSSTDAVVYITKSTNDDWGLYVNNAGLDYGTYTRVSPSANYAFAIHNGTTWTTRITGNAIIYLGEKNAIEGNYDSWLRLNNSSQYASGVYTPGVMRADGGFNVSGSTVWHAGNDGSGSGLDADTVDGVQADNIVYGNARGTNDSVTTDADGLDKTGFYTSGEFVTRPESVDNWMYIQHIKLYNSNTGYQKQIGYDTYDDRMWVRTKNSNTWSSWKQIWTSDSLTNLSQLTNGPGYITSYTETDTLNSVTGRGATTSNTIQVGKLGIGRAAASNESISVENPEGRWLIQGFRSDVSVGGLHTNDGILHVQAASVRIQASSSATWNGDTLATRPWVIAQGYITGYTETDTLASVTGRGATTNTASVFRGGLYGQKAQVAGDYTSAALWTESYDNTATGIAFHISGNVGKFLEMRTDGILYWEDRQVWTSGNLTSLSQLANDPGYLTSLPSHNHDDRYLVKGGSWYGAGLPGSRWGGFSVDGGEIVFGNGLPNAGQMGMLIDGAYLAGENNGFWSLPSDNTWSERRGMSWNGTYLDFTTNSPTAQFTNLRLANGFEIQQGGSNYGRFNSWVHLNGHYGFYSDLNGAHIYPNDGSYGSWKIAGSRNDYRGLQFSSGVNGDVSLMIHVNSNITGFHNASYDWQFYWSAGTLYCFKDNYGGGTQATVLDSVNYTDYAATSGHTHDLMRYSLRAPGNVDSLTASNFIDQLFGTSANGWTTSTARWNTTPSGLSGMNSYGTMFAWSGSDTHGFIATDYSTANIQVGGGNANLINWRVTLIHNLNIGSYALTSYTETDTLQSVTDRGATTTTPIIVTAGEGREVAVYMPSSYTTNDLVSGHEYGWYSDHWRLGMTRSGGAAGADFVVQWNGTRKLSLTNSGDVTITGTISTVAGNSTQWNTAYGWGNHAGLYLSLTGGGSVTGRTDFKELGIKAEGSDSVAENGFFRWANTGEDRQMLTQLNAENGLAFWSYEGSSWANVATLSQEGNFTVSGTITEQSSRRYKENIINLESITEKVDRLRPVRYNKIGNTNTEIGLIAEEVAEVFPEFVNYNAKGEVESLNYTRLSVVLLQTVKELSDKINKLETK